MEGVERVILDELKAKISDALDQAFSEAEAGQVGGIERVQELLVEKGVLRADEVGSGARES